MITVLQQQDAYKCRNFDVFRGMNLSQKFPNTHIKFYTFTLTYTNKMKIDNNTFV